MLLLLGYDLFVAGCWDFTYFFLDYTFLAAFPIAFGVWKLVRKTRLVKPGTADLTVGGLVSEIDEYEELASPKSPGRRWWHFRRSGSKNL